MEFELESSVATATEIAESEWKRELESTRSLFRYYLTLHSDGSHWDWLHYAGRQRIANYAASYVWQERQNKLRKKPQTNKTMRFGTPYEQSMLNQ